MTLVPQVQKIQFEVVIKVTSVIGKMGNWSRKPKGIYICSNIIELGSDSGGRRERNKNIEKIKYYNRKDREYKSQNLCRQEQIN